MHAAKIHIMATIANYQPKVWMLIGATMRSYGRVYNIYGATLLA